MAEHLDDTVDVVPICSSQDTEIDKPNFPSSKSVDNMESILLENTLLDDTGEVQGDENLHQGSSLIDSDIEESIVTSTPSARPDAAKFKAEEGPVKPLAQYFLEADQSGSGDFFDCVTALPEPDTIDSAQDAIADLDINTAVALETECETTPADVESDVPIQRTVKSVSFQQNLSSQASMTPDSVPSASQSDCDVTTPSSSSGRVRTTSMSEEIPVALQETKGVGGLVTTPSTKNLSKFFTDDAGNDSDGKSFFDSFTVSESDGDRVLPGVAHSVSQDSQPDSITDSLPPETPPIPEASPFLSQQTVPVPTAGEVFTKGLSSSDVDRRYDAWIPSQHTQQILVDISTNTTAASQAVSPEHLTMPGVVLDEPLGDAISELMDRYCEEDASERPVLTVDNVPKDVDGLRQLISAECYRSAVELTTRLLTDYGQGTQALNTPTTNTPHSLQLWFVRLSLFIKLRLYTHAETELHAFANLDKPDLYYEFYQDTYFGRRGSMVPFEMRMLHAGLPLYLGKTQESLDRLCYVNAITSRILQNLDSGLTEDGSMFQLSDESRAASRELWKERERTVLFTKINCFLHIKDYKSAIELCTTLFNQSSDKQKNAVLSAMGRIYLQMGDIDTAQTYFAKADTSSDERGSALAASKIEMNKSMVSLGKGEFTAAKEHLQTVLKHEPTNTVAVNNMAVCALYSGRLKEAITILEDLINSDPCKYLQESILFNLCTLYELESSHAMKKKKRLLLLVNKHRGNGFNASCLKLN